MCLNLSIYTDGDIEFEYLHTDGHIESTYTNGHI